MGCHRLQLRPYLASDRPLRVTEVAAPHGAHFAREPFLFLYPLNRCQAVITLLAQAREIPTRSKGPPAALNQYLETALSERPAEQKTEKPPPAVGRPAQYQRKVVPSTRDIVIRQKDGTVGHRYFYIAFYGYITGCSWREPEKPSENTTGNAHHPLLVNVKPHQQTDRVPVTGNLLQAAGIPSSGSPLVRLGSAVSQYFGRISRFSIFP